MMAQRRYPEVVCAYLALCILLGGASAAGVAANLVLQLGAIPLIALAVVRLRGGEHRGGRHGALLLIAAGILLLPLLQLVPLPPGTWRNLPERAVVVEGFGTLGMQLPWLPISLDPPATLAAWLALLPALAMLLAVMTIDARERVWIGWTVLAAAVVSALIGIIQFVSGELYVYDITSMGSGVGFFANRNHLATLLLVALPTLTLQLSNTAPPAVGAGWGWSTRDLFAFGLLAILLLGLVAAGSRAGLGLALPVLITSIGLRMRAHSGENPARLIAAAVGCSAVILAVVALGPALTRMSSAVDSFTEDETRVLATRITAEAGWQVFPVGTGFGTFDAVFRMVGGDANLAANFINHAHNDFIELWLTGGLPAVVLLVAFLWWFAGAARAGWRARNDNAGAVPRVAAVTVAVVIVHSLVDYPLRTAAISAILGASCSLLLDPIGRRHRRHQGAHPYRQRAVAPVAGLAADAAPDARATVMAMPAGGASDSLGTWSKGHHGR